MLLPIIVVLTYGTLYLVDIVRARLANHQSARYTAFALAHTALHDYKDDGFEIPANIPFIGGMFGRLGDASGAVVREAQTTQLARQRDESETIMTLEQRSVSITYDKVNHFPKATVIDLASAAGAGGTATFIIGLIGDILNYMLQAGTWRMGYNSAPLAQAESTMRVTLPSSSWFRFASRGRQTLRTSFSFQDQVALIADPWALDDGRDVRGGGYIGFENPDQTSEISRMQTQVNRLYLGQGFFFNSSSSTGRAIQDGFDAFADALGFVLAGDDLGSPLKARVSMYNYQSDNRFTNKVDRGRTDFEKNTGARRLYDEEVHVFDTTHMADDPSADDRGENIDVFKLRGKYFMGCKSAQSTGCTYE